MGKSCVCYLFSYAPQPLAVSFVFLAILSSASSYISQAVSKCAVNHKKLWLVYFCTPSSLYPYCGHHALEEITCYCKTFVAPRKIAEIIPVLKHSQ